MTHTKNSELFSNFLESLPVVFHRLIQDHQVRFVATQ